MAESQPSPQAARNALKWLVAAQRPVTVTELNSIILIGRSQEGDLLKAAGAFMTTEAQTNRHNLEAVSTIEALLGDKVVLSHDRTIEYCINVKLAFDYPYQNESDGGFDEEVEHFPLIADIDFTIEQAHQYAASICLGVCRATAPSQARLGQWDPGLLPLFSYAWTYWSAHVCLATGRMKWSPRTVSAMVLEHEVGVTIRNVLLDTVSFLVLLNNQLVGYTTSQCQTQGQNDVDEVVLLGKEAIDILHLPLSLLSGLVPPDAETHDPHVFKLLSAARHRFAAPSFGNLGRLIFGSSIGDLHYNMQDSAVHHQDTRQFNANAPPPVTRGLDTDMFLTIVEAQQELKPFKDVLWSLAASARHLRLLCERLARGNLYLRLIPTQLRHEETTVNALWNISKFLEAAACYPLWGWMHKVYDKPYLDVLDPNLYHNQGKWRARYREDNDFARYAFVEHRPEPALNSDQIIFGEPIQTDKSTALSAAQVWVVIAKALLNIRDNSPGHQDHWPAELLACLHGTGPRTTPYFDDIHETYLHLKSAVLLDGHYSAFKILLIGIVANQVRTIFAPWLGVDVWQNPMEQLRLSRTNPEVFLDEFHSYKWTGMAFSVIQRLLVEYLAKMALKATLETSVVSKTSPLNKRHLELRVGYLLWLLTTVEYVFSRAVNLVAVVNAIWNLTSGGSEAGHMALRMVIANRWPKMMMTAGQMLWFARFTALPILALNARCIVNGHLGFPFFTGILVALVRAIIVYRSFFFIPLQMSGLFVAAGWLAVGCWVLCDWFWDDPLGIKLSLELARRGSARAEGRVERGLLHRKENPDLY